MFGLEAQRIAFGGAGLLGLAEGLEDLHEGLGAGCVIDVELEGIDKGVLGLAILFLSK